MSCLLHSQHHTTSICWEVLYSNHILIPYHPGLYLILTSRFCSIDFRCGNDSNVVLLFIEILPSQLTSERVMVLNSQSISFKAYKPVPIRGWIIVFHGGRGHNCCLLSNFLLIASFIAFPSTNCQFVPVTKFRGTISILS